MRRSTIRHRLFLPLQCVALVLLSLSLGFCLWHKLWFCSLLLVSVILLFILQLVHQQRKSEEALKRLIDAIRFSDYSLSFRPCSPTPNPTLTQALEQALEQFRSKMYVLEAQHIYYETLLGTIDSGLLVFHRNGRIEWYNKTVLQELGIKNIRELSDLKIVHPSLPSLLGELTPGITRIFRMEKAGRIQEIALNLVIFHIQGKELLLVSLKNIHSVLENKEIEAWQKLIRVLTHEIMNSLAPIISLSETLAERINESSPKNQLPPMTVQALQAIHRRSKGLLDFVQNYRKLTRIPAPQFSMIAIKDLFAEIQKLHFASDIRYHFSCPDDSLQILADRSQIEQVLLNLIRNAEEACTEIPEPAIHLSACMLAETKQIAITVEDNGPGIVPEALDKIFVPFFTTKPGGSGIGLSLCKQIMTLHKGNIAVRSHPGQGSCFTLLF